MKTSLISRTQRVSRKAQRGFVQGLSIILVVLAIIGVGILLIGINYLSKSKVQNEIQYVTDLMGNTKSYANQIGLFDNANSNIQALEGRGFFPPNMVAGAPGARVITNQWKGVMDVAVGTINVAGDSLDFTSPGFPDTACKQVATGLNDIAARIRINGVIVKAPGAPAVAATVDAQCTTGNNTFVYTLAS